MNQITTRIISGALSTDAGSIELHYVTQAMDSQDKLKEVWLYLTGDLDHEAMVDLPGETFDAAVVKYAERLFSPSV